MTNDCICNALTLLEINADSATSGISLTVSVVHGEQNFFYLFLTGLAG